MATMSSMALDASMAGNLHVDGKAPLNASGLGLGVHASGIDDVLLLNPADLGDLVGRILLDTLDERL